MWELIGELLKKHQCAHCYSQNELSPQHSYGPYCLLSCRYFGPDIFLLDLHVTTQPTKYITLAVLLNRTCPYALGLASILSVRTDRRPSWEQTWIQCSDRIRRTNISVQGSLNTMIFRTSMQTVGHMDTVVTLRLATFPLFFTMT